MLISVCKSKIALATVTDAELFYEGSITIDDTLIRAADLIPGEKVQVLNINNGQRFETYVIKGKAGSGEICLNGPAARLGLVGDKVTIISYAMMSQDEARAFSPKIYHLNERNEIKD